MVWGLEAQQQVTGLFVEGVEAQIEGAGEGGLVLALTDQGILYPQEQHPCGGGMVCVC